MQQAETRFATVNGDRVAYQVLGEGPRDLLCEDRGVHEIKGVPDKWPLFSAMAPRA